MIDPKEVPNQILRIVCRDEKGIVAWVTGLVSQYGGNIVDLDQHVEPDANLFAMRLEIEGLYRVADLRTCLVRNAYYDFEFILENKQVKKRMAIMVTKEEACLNELLLKQKTGDLNCEIPLIIGNRKNLENVASEFGIPFYYMPINAENKHNQELEIKALLDKYEIDLVVLARYMRILSENFVNFWEGRMINIHHSFLPAFKGAKPYHQAWKRGVKIIGATAHYVSADLDEGPIIHQAVKEIDHRYSIKELVRTGRDIEKQVLVEAVRAHLDGRIVPLGKRTIVFR